MLNQIIDIATGTRSGRSGGGSGLVSLPSGDEEVESEGEAELTSEEEESESD